MSADEFELPDDAVVDFREPAARESLRIVQANRGVIPPDRSLCLPATDSAGDSLRGLAVGVLAILIGGVGGLVLGAVLGLTSAKSLEKGEAPWRLVVALGGTFGGIGLLLSNGLFQRRYTRRRIGQRYEELATLCGGAAPVWVGLEEAVSFHRFKLVPEDVAFVGFDPAARLVVIEGVRHRYRIRGDDVLSVGQLPGGGSSATAIAYQVGDAQLAIALQSTSVWHELKKQTVGAKRDPLLRRVQETLGHES